MNPLIASLRFPISPKIDKTSLQRSGNLSAEPTLNSLKKELAQLQVQQQKKLMQLRLNLPFCDEASIIKEEESLVFRIERKRLEINQFWTTLYQDNQRLEQIKRLESSFSL
jgi:hypothetical protein